MLLNLEFKNWVQVIFITIKLVQSNYTLLEQRVIAKIDDHNFRAQLFHYCLDCCYKSGLIKHIYSQSHPIYITRMFQAFLFFKMIVTSIQISWHNRSDTLFQVDDIL